MNKIFKIIWSKTKNSYVVVSEIAKRSGKCSSSLNKKLIAAFLAAGTVLSVTGSAWAEDVEYQISGSGNTVANPSATVWGSSNYAGVTASEKTDILDLIAQVFLEKGHAPMSTGEKSAYGSVATAWGAGNMAYGQRSTAFGEENIAYGVSSTVFGSQNEAWGNAAVAWGEMNKAYGYNATAFGQNTEASNQQATAFGANTKALSVRSTAFGDNTVAGNLVVNPETGRILIATPDDTAFGFRTQAIGGTSTAFGSGSIAKGEVSTAFGSSTIASGQYSTAFGMSESRMKVDEDGNPVIDEDGNFVIEITAQLEASGRASTAFGYGTRAKGTVSTAYGYKTYAEGTASTAFGINTKTKAQGATAFGQGTWAIKPLATAFGISTLAGGQASTAFGGQAVAAGDYSTAVGLGSNAYGRNSLAALGGITGKGTVVPIKDPETQEITGYTIEFDENNKGEGALAIGKGAKALKDYTYAIGQNANAEKADTIAIGNNASVTVEGGVALGKDSVALMDAGEKTGYDPLGEDHSGDTSGTWNSTAAAVSVGGGTNEDGKKVTRQITNVAAGYELTDAVNVAQLKAAVDSVEGVHDYHVKSISPATDTNYNNTGATGNNALAAGVSAKAQGHYSTVVGDKSEVLSTERTYTVGMKNPFTGETITRTVDQSGVQGVGAVNVGAMNIVGAADDNAYGFDGVANSIVGVANKTEMANGAIIMGAGNVITNSYDDEALKAALKENATALLSEDAATYRKLVKDAGGDVLAIGGANEADYAVKSSMIGVKNKIIGTSNSIAELNSSIGYSNTIENGSNNSIIGTNRKVSDVNGVIIIGSADPIGYTEEEKPQPIPLPTSVENAVVIGTNANVTLEKYESVALGSYSKADKLGGYDTAGENDVEIGKLKLSSKVFTGIGNDVAGTVSIGYVPEQQQKSRAVTGRVKTRTLTYVGAGEISKDSTDAINGSQLYAAIDAMQFDIKAGDNITVATETIDGIKTYTISSSNATAVKPGKNVAVEGPTETNGAAGTPTGGDTNASVDQGTYKTDNYTVNAADSKVTGFTVESSKPTTSGITTTTDYTITVTSDEQSVVDGKIQSETVDRSVTFTVTDTNTTYTIKADPGEDGSNIVNTYTVTGSDGKDLGPIVDTDTQYELSGEKGETNDNQTTPYTISLKSTDGSENTFKLMDTRNTVEAGDDTIVVKSTENKDGSLTYTITSKAKSVSNVEVKAGSDNVIVTSDGDEEKKVYTVDVKTDGEVASGNTGIVTGDTVYKETRVEKDGNYIKKDNTAAENFVALDEKVQENATSIENINNNINNTYNQISRLDDRMKKGLAGAAALAALHPMDFNPDDKLQFSAGVGNYRGETAAALGMFYRPDESVMFSLGGTFGNSDNLVNAGITFGLDGTRNRITRSRTAMAKEIVELRSLVTQMAARMDRLEGGTNLETAMFPDVPENHWAYEYVEDLQKRGAIKGYPDGLFKGDRSMSRYEFAAMLDRLVRSGVTLDSKIAKEFEPELGRIYVERISGQDNDRKKVERVRVNNSDSKYPEGKTRDVYGSKIQPVVPEKAVAQ